MKGRKFSFDLPRLKIGNLKPGDNKAIKAAAAYAVVSPIDSPLEQPKSVRPPLPNHVEADLRAACAYVLQNFKPSHMVYEEQYGKKAKQQLDYASIKGNAQNARLQPPGAPLSKVNTRSNVATELGDYEEQPNPEVYRYKPDVKTEDLFKQDEAEQMRLTREARARAEVLMGGSLATSVPLSAPPPTAARGRADSHRRSKSTPQSLPSAVPVVDESVLPQTLPRTDSTDTSGSTPRTDSIEYQWSNSTAPTSAAITPARSSKRTSSQAFQPENESSSFPKVEAVDAEWMKSQLEKHKREHQEQHPDSTPRRKRAESDVPANMPSSVVHVPTRKPVAQVGQAEEIAPPASLVTQNPLRSHPPPNLVKGVTTPPCTLATRYGRPSHEQPVRSTRADEPAHAASRSNSDSQRTAKLSRSRSRARSITRGVHEYFRPGSTQRPATSHGDDAKSERRQRSRSRSVARHVKQYFQPPKPDDDRTASVDAGQTAEGEATGGDAKELRRTRSRSRSVAQRISRYFKPPTTTSSRSASVDIPSVPALDLDRGASAASHGRSHSRDSFVSARSAQAASILSERMRTARPRFNGKSSRPSDDSSRPGTSSSDGRGRTFARGMSPQQPRSQPVNLNRDLPPLPSLDTWKVESPTSDAAASDESEAAVFETPITTRAEEAHRSMQPEDVVEMYERSFTPVKSPPVTDDNPPRADSRNPSIPAVDDAATFFHSASSSEDYDVYSGQDDYELVPTSSFVPIAPTSTIDQGAFTHGRQRGKSIQQQQQRIAHPPPFAPSEDLYPLDLSLTRSRTPDTATLRSPIVNYSRPGAMTAQGLRRRPSHPDLTGATFAADTGNAAAAANADFGAHHVRNRSNTAEIFGNLSIDDDVRRLREALVSPGPNAAAAAAAAAAASNSLPLVAREGMSALPTAPTAAMAAATPTGNGSTHAKMSARSHDAKANRKSRFWWNMKKPVGNGNCNGNGSGSSGYVVGSSSKQQRKQEQQDWMERVLRSGSHGGGGVPVVAADEDVASPPVVRY